MSSLNLKMVMKKQDFNNMLELLSDYIKWYYHDTVTGQIEDATNDISNLNTSAIILKPFVHSLDDTICYHNFSFMFLNLKIAKELAEKVGYDFTAKKKALKNFKTDIHLALKASDLCMAD